MKTAQVKGPAKQPAKGGEWKITSSSSIFEHRLLRGPDGKPVRMSLEEFVDWARNKSSVPNQMFADDFLRSRKSQPEGGRFWSFPAVVLTPPGKAFEDVERDGTVVRYRDPKTKTWYLFNVPESQMGKPDRVLLFPEFFRFSRVGFSIDTLGNREKMVTVMERKRITAYPIPSQNGVYLARVDNTGWGPGTSRLPLQAGEMQANPQAVKFGMESMKFLIRTGESTNPNQAFIGLTVRGIRGNLMAVSLAVPPSTPLCVYEIRERYMGGI